MDILKQHMGHYIDADLLLKEIEKRIKSSESCPFIEAEVGAEERREGKIQGYKEILVLLYSLQQEQPEVDLDELINDFLLNNYEFLVERDSNVVVQKLARHFYELGLNVRKEE